MIASRLAAETALAVFQVKAKPEDFRQRMVRADVRCRRGPGLPGRAGQRGRMATTLLVSIFRQDKVTIAHVGDSRAYLIRAGKIKRLTTDHSYTALQVKLGLLLERNAMTSPNRSTLTRSIGYEPMCHFDIHRAAAQRGHHRCNAPDGLYGFILDEEILEAVRQVSPGRGLQTAHCPGREAAGERQRFRADRPGVGCRAGPGGPARGRPGPQRLRAANSALAHVLDERFEITDVIAKSGMASLFKANDRQTGAAVAIKVPYLQIESDLAGFDRFRREEEIGLQLNHPYILKVIPVEKKSRPYLVMEYLGRPDPQRAVEERPAPARAGCGEDRQPHLRGAGLYAPERGDPPGFQAAEHHALQ